MCDGEGLGLIQMMMTPAGLAVAAGLAAVLFVFGRWVLKNST
ncbi:MAG TPA: hypothetical protein VE999_14150 [Gemmataceae bacterium]|nr:hypothetical protein [Gemmataceae bacterium]